MSVDGVENSQSTMSLSFITAATQDNAQYEFAVLQLELAESCKSAAESRLEAIKELQEKSKALTEAVVDLRTVKSLIQSNTQDDDNYYVSFKKFGGDISYSNISSQISRLEAAYDLVKNYSGNSDEHGYRIEVESRSLGDKIANVSMSGDKITVPGLSSYYDILSNFDNKYGYIWADELKDYLQIRINLLSAAQICSENGVDISSWPTSGNLTTSRVEVLIAQIQAAQEEISSDINTHMVFVQDSMSQYSSYLEGAFSAASEAVDIASAIAKQM